MASQRRSIFSKNLGEVITRLGFKGIFCTKPWMCYFRNHVPLHWRNMVLVLVVLVNSMEQLVSINTEATLNGVLWEVSFWIFYKNKVQIVTTFSCPDVHLDCEARIAKFLGTPDSILYSYGLSTMFSAIPCFCKKGDIIVV